MNHKTKALYDYPVLITPLDQWVGAADPAAGQGVHHLLLLGSEFREDRQMSTSVQSCSVTRIRA